MTERDLVDLAVEYGMIKYAGQYYQSMNNKQSAALIRTIKKIADQLEWS